eukprot:SAG31_NODE_13_length_37961_cov_21.751307_28_plen_78_part_00
MIEGGQECAKLLGLTQIPAVESPKEVFMQLILHWYGTTAIPAFQRVSDFGGGWDDELQLRRRAATARLAYGWQPLIT